MHFTRQWGDPLHDGQSVNRLVKTPCALITELATKRKRHRSDRACPLMCRSHQLSWGGIGIAHSRLEMRMAWVAYELPGMQRRHR